MAYYLLENAKGKNMMLTTYRVFNQEEIKKICKEAYQEDENMFLAVLQKSGISRCLPHVPPRYDFTIRLQESGEVEVIKHTQFSIVMFSETGRLKRIVDKSFETKEEAEQQIERLKPIYGDDLFVSEK